MLKQKQKNKIVIGVTGSFGSGKSTVARVFASRGARIIDADKIAYACIKRGAKAYKAIISSFGPGVIGKNKEIDRARLGRLVFGDQRLLKKLNHIVHPEVIRIIKAKVRSLKKGVIILDAPLLLEAGLKKAVDKLVVVIINRESQVKRLIKKTALGRQDILKRIKSQISQGKKLRLADFIIDNSGSMAQTRKQVGRIITKILN